VSPIRLFEPGEAANVAAALAARPASPESRPVVSVPHVDGAFSPSAMRLFGPGEASDVAAEQAAHPAHPESRPAPPVHHGDEAFSPSAMRVFGPGEATDVAMAQAGSQPVRRERPRTPRAVAGRGREATPQDLGAWAYPPELGVPPDGVFVRPVGMRAGSVEVPFPDPLLPEEPRRKRGPYSVSIVAHVLIIALVIARTTWMAAHLEASSAPDPGIFIALQEPLPEPAPTKPPIAPPTASKPSRSEPAPREEAPRPQAQPLTPPAVPKELPPETPLPPPTRMGELVPVPHYPVPGTVPPEEQKTGKAGAPGEKTPPPEPVGKPDGTSDTDAGAGSLTGPGSPSAGDEEPSRDTGLLREKFYGGLDIPSHGYGRSKQGSGDKEGGGSRRGIDFRVPGGDLGDFSFEDKDYDWNDYHSQMYYAILRAWYNRLYLTTANFERWSYLKGGRALRGSVLIRFVIERTGAVSSIEVLEPSVMPPLDESARAALKEVILPRLPADFPKDREGVTGRFIMDVDDLGYFKQGLAYQKSRGLF